MLHQLTLGEGAEEVVMLHGWAMHGGVMRDFAACLAARFRVTLIDLPGHGRSHSTAAASLQGITDAVLEQAPCSAHWLGWSLGALPCLQAAHSAASRLRSVILMAGSPRFVRDEAWPGLDESLLLQFERELEADYRLCLQRFLGLQVWGMEGTRRLVQHLRLRLEECEPPAPSALQAGLEILRCSDLRGVLAQLRVPVLAVLGQRDRLVPPSMGVALKELNSRVEVEMVQGAAHLPFWTHREDTGCAVERFLRRHAG
jgi:pimeloyl-[acyl-carrier protein] methyl ester esterase